MRDNFCLKDGNLLTVGGSLGLFFLHSRTREAKEGHRVQPQGYSSHVVSQCHAAQTMPCHAADRRPRVLYTVVVTVFWLRNSLQDVTKRTGYRLCINVLCRLDCVLFKAHCLWPYARNIPDDFKDRNDILHARIFANTRHNRLWMDFLEVAAS